MSARTFQNVGPAEIRISCELVVPVGHTSLPIELGGLVVTDLGEKQIRGQQELGHLVVSTVADMMDKVPPPPAPPGRAGEPTPIGTVDGEVQVGDLLTVNAAPTEVTIDGHRVLQYNVANSRSAMNINVMTMAQLGVGQVLTCTGLSTGTGSFGGTTYRMAMTTT